MDAAQPVPPSLAMDSVAAVHPRPSNHPRYHSRRRLWPKLLRESAPRDPVGQGVHISPEVDTAKPVVPVAIFPRNTNFATKIRNGLLETKDNNAIKPDLNANTIFPERVYLKRWKDPDKADARHKEVKEEPESVKCYSIEFGGKLCSDTGDERCTTEMRTRLMTSSGRSRQRSR